MTFGEVNFMECGGDDFLFHSLLLEGEGFPTLRLEMLVT